METARKIPASLAGIGRLLNNFFPKTQEDLDKAHISLSSEKYFAAAFFSSLVYAFLLLVFLAGLLWVQGQLDAAKIFLALLFSATVFGLFLFLHSIGPKIAARKYAAGVDKNLVSALNNLQAQVASGIPLFEAMVNVGKANYGEASLEFESMTKEMAAGENEISVLEKKMNKTGSEFLKKTCWQLLSSLRSGSSTEGALTSVADSLSSEQFRSIKKYTAELNLWILLYLLVATAIPTIGITFLVVLSAMAGISIGPEVILGMVFFAAMLQAVLIGFVKTRVPWAIA